MGRSAQGVRLLSIDKPDFVIGLDRIVKEDAAADTAETETDAPGETTDAPQGDDAQEQLPFQEE
jgi:DNA gyrase subunit A